MCQFDASKRFASSQFKTKLPLYCQLISTFFHGFWCYYFIKVLNLKIVGAAISLNITNLTNLLLLDCWMSFSGDFKETLVKYDCRSFTDWGAYMDVGIFGALLECLGWWNLDICFLFSGYLGVESIATQVVVMQIKNFTNMIPTGVAFAASGLVGNCIGMKQVQRGKDYAKVSVLCSMIATSIILLIFQLCSESLAKIFTDDPKIVSNTKKCLWSLFLYIFFSTIKGVQNGVVRALGQQKRNTLLTLIFAYIVGVPCGFLLCFKLNMALQGIWLGISLANALLVFAIHKLIENTNWERIANPITRVERDFSALNENLIFEENSDEENSYTSKERSSMNSYESAR